MSPRPPTPPLFPYTTLFRSSAAYRVPQPTVRRGRFLPARNRGCLAGPDRAEYRYQSEHWVWYYSGHPKQEGASMLNRSEEHTSELQSPCNLVCRLLLEKKKK